MPERFYAPFPLQPNGEVTLEEAEAHHLAHVLRLGTGDEVVLFDGAGAEADARIERASKRGVTLRVLRVKSDSAGSVSRLTLATAAPKGDRFRWLIEKATELGVGRLVPLNTERSVVDPRDTKLDRMRQAVVAACKQCGRNRLMKIAPTQSLDWVLENHTADGVLLVADRAGASPREWIEQIRRPRPVIALVGPEGGLTRPEIDRAVAAGGKLVSLGPHILRIETAALALAALCGGSE